MALFVDLAHRDTLRPWRAPGALLPGCSDGGVEGIDLTPQARQALYAQQILLRIRFVGPLIAAPPPGELVPRRWRSSVYRA
jgi:hypothetical protein